MNYCIPGEDAPDKTDYDPYFTRNMTSFSRPVPPPDWEIAVKLAVYAVAFLAAVCGNSIVILIIIVNKRMRTTTNVLILNLAISDLMVAFFCMWVHAGNSVTTEWPFGHYVCKVNIFIQVTAVTSSVLTLTAISVERFFAIVFPMKPRMSPLTIGITVAINWVLAIVTAVTSSVLTLTAISVERFFAIVFPMKPRMSPLTIGITVAINWVLAIGMGSPHLFVRHQFEYYWKDRHQVWCTEVWPEVYVNAQCESDTPGQRIYYTVEGVVMYFIPIVIMLCAYALILAKVILRKQPGLSGTACRAQERSRNKVIRMLVIVLVTFIVCWTPQQVFILWEIYRDREPIQDYILDIKYAGLFMAYMNSSINPVLYGGFNENFRRGFRDAFHCLLWKKRNRVSPVPGQRIPFGSNTTAVNDSVV